MTAPVDIAERGRPLGSALSVWVSFRLIPALGAALVRLWSYTLRVRREGFEAVEALAARDERFILSFWHRRLAMMYMAYPFHRRDVAQGHGVAILASDSKDGERSTATWRWFGIHSVRGTASQDGAKALVRMIQAVRSGYDFALTPDGPRGPAQVPKPGIVALAKKTGAWVVPITLAYDRAFTLHTWDRMVIPMPFATCTLRYGAPFQVAPDADEVATVSRLQADMDRLETWAETQLLP